MITVQPYDIEVLAEVPLDIPDPITFVLGGAWLGQTILYPRQATLLKIIFLREDLFTEYDYAVVAEWEETFKKTGSNGITPNILDRMSRLRVQGYKWFREVILAIGRRGGKGHISAQAMAYVLWHYMAKLNPQEFYGIAPNKKLECLIYAGKKEQARKNLWADLHDTIINSTCYAKYVSKPLGESLTIAAPADLEKMKDRERRGLKISSDQATFRIEPKEATLMSGRGGASFCVAFDEMAHVVATGANRSAEEVYGQAIPSLGQFKKDAFIIEPSSTWQMTGQFYTNYLQSLEKDPETGEPVYLNKMMIQLTSWDIYKDWEIAHTIDVFPDNFVGDVGEYLDDPLPKYPKLESAPQEYDDEMRLEERGNPDTFAVERLSRWATTMDAYLDPKKIEEMFNHDLQMRTRGKLDTFYYAHIDPSTSGANFGLSVAHTEPHPDHPDLLVCVFDYIYHWDPADFEDHHIDYIQVIDELWSLVKSFPIDELTFDQFNAGPIRSMLQKKALQRAIGAYKQTNVHQVTATAPLNWKKAENFKTALNQGWIWAPQYDQAELELKFLRLINTATTQRVEKQDMGPCTTKDVADTMFQCVHALLGDQIEAIKAGLGRDPVAASLQGGITPFGNVTSEDEKMFARLGGFSGSSGAGRYVGAPGFGGSASPSRGVRRDEMPNRRRV